VRIAFAGDHHGVALKAHLIDLATKAGHQALDLGAHDTQPSDYPDFARAIGAAIREGRAERGILLCGSGVGASVAANKIDGIRAGLCHDAYSAHQGVEHDDCNVLCLGTRVIGVALAEELASVFLAARFTGEDRHRRRLAKVTAIEQQRA
jgi:RpiB/LacA/LacB family sugar-phosphate isomerase